MEHPPVLTQHRYAAMLIGRDLLGFASIRERHRRPVAECPIERTAHPDLSAGAEK
jgi:hypothetical protein